MVIDKNAAVEQVGMGKIENKEDVDCFFRELEEYVERDVEYGGEL